MPIQWPWVSRSQYNDLLRRVEQLEQQRNPKDYSADIAELKRRVGFLPTSVTLSGAPITLQGLLDLLIQRFSEKLTPEILDSAVSRFLNEKFQDYEFLLTDVEAVARAMLDDGSIRHELIEKLYQDIHIDEDTLADPLVEKLVPQALAKLDINRLTGLLVDALVDDINENSYFDWDDIRSRIAETLSERLTVGLTSKEDSP